MQEVPVPLPVGTVIQGFYIIESLLGNSNFGSVYLVRDQRDKQKLFALAELINPDERGEYCFTLEYVSPTPLDDWALPQAHYVFNDDKLGRAYLLMSYIEEPNLEILRLQRPAKRFPLPQAMTLMAPIINAVTYLHQQRPPLIHRDIKPANIIVPRAVGLPVLVAFSIVKEHNPTTTAVDYFTPGYAATEQYSGECSTRTDIYGLGATFYTLLTGVIPPDALYRSTQLGNEKIDPLEPVNNIVPAIPMSIGKAIERAMSLDAQHRFSSVEQFREALWLVLAEQPAPVFDTPTVPKDPPAVPTPGPERAIEQTIEKPVREPLLAGSVPESIAEPEHQDAQKPSPVVPEPESIEEREDLDVVPIPHSVEEREDPDATVRLPKLPSVVPIPHSVEGQEHLDIEKPLPKLPSVAPAGVKEQKGLNVVKLLPKSSGDVKAPISLRKLGVLFIVLALLISLGIGTSFLSRARSHIAAHSAIPASHTSSPASRPTSASVASSNSTLAGIYTGTIYDISANVTTKMSLTGIQQTQITIGGNFTGLHRTGAFNGIIDPHPPKHIQFTVKDSAGHVILSFDGHMQSDGELSGSYCSVDQNARCTGEYGLWSVAPAS